MSIGLGRDGNGKGVFCPVIRRVGLENPQKINRQNMEKRGYGCTCLAFYPTKKI